MNDVGRGGRSYLGGPSACTALTTVVREIPNRAAICAFGNPSEASLLISAQSSKVITLQSLSVHFSSAAIDQISSAADRGALCRQTAGFIDRHEYLVSKDIREMLLGELNTLRRRRTKHEHQARMPEVAVGGNANTGGPITIKTITIELNAIRPRVTVAKSLGRPCHGDCGFNGVSGLTGTVDLRVFPA